MTRKFSKRSAAATGARMFMANGTRILSSSARNFRAPLSPPHKFDVLAADFFRVKIPQKPIVIRNEAVQFAVPFPGQSLVELLEKGQKRALWRKPLFVPVNRHFCAPIK